MPYEPQKEVAKMMRTFGQEVRLVPAMVNDYKESLLTTNLVYEECLEFVRAMGFEPNGIVGGKDTLTLGGKPDLIEAADAIGDMLVVVYGAANRLGIDAEAVFNEVMRSNNTKIWPDGTVHKRELDGKVIKPSTYSPANIEDVLISQGLPVEYDSMESEGYGHGV